MESLCFIFFSTFFVFSIIPVSMLKLQIPFDQSEYEDPTVHCKNGDIFLHYSVDNGTCLKWVKILKTVF